MSDVLRERFDAVVMLTWSNWFTEMRSNRYHYATRFARHLPVIFVQADLPRPTFRFEPTEVSNVRVLHVYQSPGSTQQDLLSRALLEARCLRPLLWGYSALLDGVFAQRFSPLKVYHATEDYFCDEFGIPPDAVARLKRMLQHADLLVSVSEGVEESYVEKGGYRGERIVLENGCDFAFWSASRADRARSERVAIYQGAVNSKLDCALLEELSRRLPDWRFWFCGPLFGEVPGWKALLQRPNVSYLGQLSIEEVRDRCGQASVGLIPFVQNELMIDRSFPLKAFEYVATGLPVVSVPIKSLLKHEGVIAFARTAEEFAAGVAAAAKTRDDPAALEKRREAARSQDYDLRFERLVEKVAAVIEARAAGPPPSRRLNVLVLYDYDSVHVSTIKEHLESFSSFSRHDVLYCPATRAAECSFSLNVFDVVVLHYTIRVSHPDTYLSPSFAAALRRFGGLKVLFIQDEYDNTETARRQIESLGIQLVFTCVPEASVDAIYPRARFRHVEFITNLTGFVPASLEQRRSMKPTSERKVHIGYRGRALPYWYGDLGQEKLRIGQVMREICEKRSIPCDIEWESEKRIYGDAWYDFLASCRATLGTESGANVFDDEGSLRIGITAALQADPKLTYEQAKQRFPALREGKVKMNQISPKIFEAIVTRTALVLFEGTYSGIVQPDIHFIPLKKDFSNVDEVLAKVADTALLERMTQRAYDDVIRSGRYGYSSFVEWVDGILASRARAGTGARLLATLTGYFVGDQTIELPVRGDSIRPTFRLYPELQRDREQVFYEAKRAPISGWFALSLLAGKSVRAAARALATVLAPFSRSRRDRLELRILRSTRRLARRCRVRAARAVRIARPREGLP
jgi:hypothetical protein